MTQEPGPHSPDVTAYRALPAVIRPRVWCACGGRMRPTLRDEYPHEFRCELCDAYVDIHPPDQGWKGRQCGGLIEGVRCNRTILFGAGVCTDCQRRAAYALQDTGPGRALLQELVGQEQAYQMKMELRREHDEERHRKRKEAEAQRQETAAYVVYYARLGNNHIKIGTTADLPRRMVELRVVNVSNLLAAEPGSYDVERQRHEQFRKWRYNRRKEDFGEGPDLLEHIRAIREQHGPPYELAAQLANKIAPH